MLDVHEVGIAVEGGGASVFAIILAGIAVAGGFLIIFAMQEMPHAGY